MRQQDVNLLHRALSGCPYYFYMMTSPLLMEGDLPIALQTSCAATVG